MAGRRGKGQDGKWKTSFLEALCVEPNVGKACKAASVSRSAAYAAYKKAEADDDNDFNELWDLAIEEGLDNYESDLRRIGVGEIRGGNATALIYLLNVRRYQKRQGNDMPSELVLKWGSK